MTPVPAMRSAVLCALAALAAAGGMATAGAQVMNSTAFVTSAANQCQQKNSLALTKLGGGAYVVPTGHDLVVTDIHGFIFQGHAGDGVAVYLYPEPAGNDQQPQSRFGLYGVYDATGSAVYAANIISGVPMGGAGGGKICLLFQGSSIALSNQIPKFAHFFISGYER